MSIHEIAESAGLLLRELTVLSVLVRIGLSVLIGGIPGAERGLRNRPAGFMTYVLVCMGSTLIMLTNVYISAVFPDIDPARLGAYAGVFEEAWTKSVLIV